MIAIPAGARVGLANGHTDAPRYGRLSLQVHQDFDRDPHVCGRFLCVQGRRGDLVKTLWHDDTGMLLYAKCLELGRVVWPQAKDGVVSLTLATLSMLLEDMTGEPRNGRDGRRWWGDVINPQIPCISRKGLQSKRQV